MNATAIWRQSRKGRAIDMVEPRADQVDFAEIADELAGINRYTGAAERPVSVAQHTIIAAECAGAFGGGARCIALVLLHDCHETRLGDTPSPAKAEQLAVARQMFGLKGEDTLRQVLAEIERRHDTAIYIAAGIEPPDAEERLFNRWSASASTGSPRCCCACSARRTRR